MTEQEYGRLRAAILARRDRWRRDVLDVTSLLEEHGTTPGLRARFEQLAAEREAIEDAADDLIARVRSENLPS